jgi:hypothetical protein
LAGCLWVHAYRDKKVVGVCVFRAPNHWEEITELFTKHFMSIAPAGVTVK